MIEPTIWDHLLVTLLALTGLYAVFRGQPDMKAMEFDEPTRIRFYWTQAVVLWIGALIVLGVWRLGGRGFDRIGITWKQEATALCLLISLGVAVAYVVDLWVQIRNVPNRDRLLARLDQDAPFLPKSPREVAHFAAIAVTAGITEEIIFRGFLISYLTAFTGTSTMGLVAAVSIPAIGFGLAHCYQRPSAVARIVVVSVAWGALFVLSGSLLLPMILHTLVDLAGGALSATFSEGSSLRRTISEAPLGEPGD